MRLRIALADGTASERIVAAPVVRLGRAAECEVAFDPVQYPKVSGMHAEIKRTSAGLVLRPLSTSNKTLLNGQPLDGPALLKAGDRIRLGFTGPTVELIGLQPPQGFDKTVPAEAAHLALLRGTAVAKRFAIGAGGVLGRDAQGVQYQLDHPHVSRRHARLAVAGERVTLTDLGSANGTFVNGRRLTASIELALGDRIDVGPFSLEYDGEALFSRSRSNNVELAARGLTRTVTDRGTGQPLTLLDDVTVVIRPREFVCLLGPSGSGKSTLLTILSGRATPNGGAVTVNGEDLHQNFAALKQDIAVVPQKDVLHDALTVGAALRYTAQLRLPPDVGPDEVESGVTDILDVVGLAHRRDTQIRHLSGGQIKRASLANELLCRPSLLFLDEVTSGLDEQTDREMMELFRLIADGGKTVVCVTHSMANVEATCHLVVFLTPGGRLAFVGTPAEALTYFRVARLGDVYRALAAGPSEEWQARFRASPHFARYINERVTHEPKSKRREPQPAAAGDNPSYPLGQSLILTHRYLAVWRGDVPALAVMVGQSLLVAILLGLVFGRLDAFEEPAVRAQTTVNLLFLLNVSCLWLGCNNAAKELVKERVIYGRERDFNLRADSYYGSKFVVLAGIALIQVALLFGIVRLWCGPAGSAAGQWAVLALLAVAGTTLGLLISAWARTEEVAAALVPIAVLPQIILAGVIAPLAGLGKALAVIGITAYWGEQALESLLPTAETTLIGLPEHGFGLATIVVIVHALVPMLASLIVLWARGRSR